MHELAEPELDAALALRGYSKEGESDTLCCDLASTRAQTGPAALAPRPDDDWLAALAAAQGQSPAQAASYRRMMARLAAPAAFATVRKDDAIASVAYGALDEGLLVIESVATVPAARRRGLARTCVGALLTWGRARGADAAVLQVESRNAAAQGLYAGLGFDRLLYRYHYRRAA